MALNRLYTSIFSTTRSMGYNRISVRGLAGLRHEGIEIKVTDNPQPKPDSSSLVFGRVFTDHMLSVSWDNKNGWNKPKIEPFTNFNLSPATTVFHYATECFEGMKAYHGVDGRCRLFRPNLNMDRLNRSADAASLPAFDGDEFLECLKDLVRLDKEWIPKTPDASLYIRPTYIGTEPSLGVKKSSSALLYVILSPVGPYFAKGTFVPVKLYADPAYIRAWEGGVGESKMGGNYGPTIKVQNVAESHGCDQVLWLYGSDNQLTEVGTMNIFVHWINENGEPEVATPPLFGTILPGVTRRSLLDLASKWGTHRVVERKVTMDDVMRSLEEGRMRELFGAGTACVVCPINKILFKGEDISIPTMDSGAEVSTRLYKELTDIQYGRTEHEWSVVID